MADGKWTTKSYDFDTPTPIPFPKDLGKTCSDLIKRIPWHEIFTEAEREIGWEDWRDDYRMSDMRGD